VSAQIYDYSETDLQLVAALLQERYGKPLSPEVADSELRLDPASDELTLCPTLYWNERGAHFVVFKLPLEQYRCQFFYTDADHYGTGRDSYADLRDCVLTVLRVQADHERQSAEVSSGIAATGPTPESGEDEYHAPLIV
jgi:hypothetical protein